MTWVPGLEKSEVKASRLRDIHTLYADNASVNTGDFNGLSQLLNEARAMEYQEELNTHLASGGGGGVEHFPHFVALRFKVYDDHNMALIFSAYNRLLLDRAKVLYSSLHHEDRRGNLVALSFFVLKHISRWLLRFLALAWHARRAKYHQTHGCVPFQGGMINVVNCSFNRFCTFGVLQRLKSRSLVGVEASNLTMGVLKQATWNLKAQCPELDELLRNQGDKEQLVTQFEQWLD